MKQQTLAQVMAVPLGQPSAENTAEKAPGRSLWPFLLLGGVSAALLLAWMRTRAELREKEEEVEHLLAEKEEKGEEIPLGKLRSPFEQSVFGTFF